MGIAERRKREKQLRREAALEAAMALYAEEGYHGITMEKIAERAELSRAALYLYFKTKDEIFISAIVDHFDYFSELLEALYDQRAVFKDRLLEEMWGRFLKFYKHDSVTFNASLYFHQNEMIRHLPEDLREMLYRSGARVVKLQHQIITYGVEEGIFMPCNPKTLSEVIWTSFLGIVNLEKSKQVMSRKTHMEETRELALKILSKGILVTPA